MPQPRRIQLAALCLLLLGGSPFGEPRNAAGGEFRRCGLAIHRELVRWRPRSGHGRIASRGLAANPGKEAQPQRSADGAEAVLAWRPLCDGRTLDGWAATEFGGEGLVQVEDGAIQLEFGESLTGITWQGDFPGSGYELRLQAMRKQGIDFFCGLTFPVGESHCSLIVAGWAGAVVGLSSIDHRDAAENETTRLMTFDNDRWYRIRVRVTPARIQAWIDDEQVVDQDIRGRVIATRPEVDLCKPLGIAAWQTQAAVKGIEYRLLPPSGE